MRNETNVLSMALILSISVGCMYNSQVARSHDKDDDDEEATRSSISKRSNRVATSPSNVQTAPVKPAPVASLAGATVKATSPKRRVSSAFGEEEPEDDEDDPKPQPKRVAAVTSVEAARSDAQSRTSAANPPRKKQSLDFTVAVEADRSPTPRAVAAAVKPAANVKTECASVLIALREPKARKGVWGRTEIVTVVELAKGLDCGDARRGGEGAAQQRAAASVVRPVLSTKEGAVVKVTEATDWTLGQDEAGKTWRSRTVTAVVEKPVTQ